MDGFFFFVFCSTGVWHRKTGRDVLLGGTANRNRVCAVHGASAHASPCLFCPDIFALLSARQKHYARWDANPLPPRESGGCQSPLGLCACDVFHRTVHSAVHLSLVRCRAHVGEISCIPETGAEILTIEKIPEISFAPRDVLCDCGLARQRPVVCTPGSAPGTQIQRRATSRIPFTTRCKCGRVKAEPRRAVLRHSSSPCIVFHNERTVLVISAKKTPPPPFFTRCGCRISRAPPTLCNQTRRR